MKAFLPYIMGIILAYLGIKTYELIAFNYELAKFYGIEWSYNKHGIAMNGRATPRFGNLISVKELEAISPGYDGKTLEERCPGIVSNKGHLTIEYILDYENSLDVCCWVSDKPQFLVPYFDKGNTRHYLCGEIPHLDHVTQPLKQVKIKKEKLSSILK